MLGMLGGALYIPKKIYLIDLDVSLVDAWRTQFRQYKDTVEALSCDYFDIPADCMVSPANSFGYMDGGLDRIISYELGDEIEGIVQSAIVKEFYGEIPVGSALLVDTGSEKWPYLAVAPTMRVPEDVSTTCNAYSAFRAILLAISKFNATNPKKRVDTLVCSGLGTGIGGMSPETCALQMKLAYESFLGTQRIASPKAIYANHRKLFKA